ncbi:50S ribosomal protein L25 [Patescibacteria group bacterium]|nr:50S ribosomal protein L25 [Patescibacteria group bacterium]
MKRLKLNVEKRELLGKKIKRLRKQGILPGNVYGKDIKSTAVQIPLAEFQKTYKEAGETGLLDLSLDGEVKPVLIHNLQVDPLTKLPLHADFFQVNLKEKVKTMVKIETTGEAKAVTDKIGIVLQPLSEVEVEALPEALPEKIEVNVEPLAAVDQQITVADLKLPQGVEILSDPSQVVVKVAELISKEAEEQAAEEAAAKEAAKTEGEAPAEGAEAVAEPSSAEAIEGKGEAKPESPKQEEKQEKK